MPTFAIAPVSVSQAESGDFPDYLQFQKDGVDLGGPTVDTVNIANGITATRGVGEDANVLTLSVDGVGGSIAVYDGGVLVADDVSALNIVGAASVTAGSAGVVNVDVTSSGGATPELLVFLSAPDILNDTDNGTWNTLTPADVVASPDATWNTDTNQLEFARTGVYEILVSSVLVLNGGGGRTIAYSLFSTIGNDIASSLFQGSIDYQAVPDANETANGTARFIEITASDADLVRDINVHLAASGEAGATTSFDLAVTVRRLGNVP